MGSDLLHTNGQVLSGHLNRLEFEEIDSKLMYSYYMSKNLPVIVTNAVHHWDAMNIWFKSHNDSHSELDEEYMQREVRKCILINH